MTILSTDNTEHYVWGDGADGWHLVSSTNLSVIEERVPPGCSEARHYHEKSEQFFYVLRGNIIIELDGTEHTLGSNQGLYVPVGMPHKVLNNTGQAVKFLVVSTPPSHNDRIKA